MRQKLWPYHQQVKGPAFDPMMWIRQAGSHNRFHLPNTKGVRAVCTIKLPVGVEREEQLNPPTAWRCKTCQRELERRTDRTRFA